MGTQWQRVAMLLLVMGGVAASGDKLAGRQFRAGSSPAGVPQEADPDAADTVRASTERHLHQHRDELVNALYGAYTTIYVADNAYIDSAFDRPCRFAPG